MMKKLYIHIEDVDNSSLPNWTTRILLKLSETILLEDLFRHVLVAYYKKTKQTIHHISLERYNVYIETPDALVERTLLLPTQYHVLLTVNTNGEIKCIDSSCTFPLLKKKLEAKHFEITIVKKDKTLNGSELLLETHGNAKKDKGTIVEDSLLVLKNSLDTARNCMQKEKFAHAKIIYETILLQLDAYHIEAMMKLSEIYILNKQFDIAMSKYLKPCWKYYTRIDKSQTFERTEVLHCGLQLAQCYMHVEQYPQALDLILEINQLSSKEWCVTCETIKNQLDLLTAQALYYAKTTNISQKQEAVSLVLSLIPDLKASNINYDALFLYSKMSMDHSEYQQALGLLLRVLTVRTNDKQVKKQFALCLKHSVSSLREKRLSEMEVVKKLIPLQWNKQESSSCASAYAYLSTLLKENGEISLARSCLKLSLLAEPLNATYILQLIHTLEISPGNDIALKKLIKFFSRISKSAKHTLSSETASILDAIESSNAEDTLSGWEIKWSIDKSETQAKDYSAKIYCNKERWNTPKFPRTEVTQYSEEDIGLLGCYFTLIKLIFLTRTYFSTLPKIISIIEPLRRKQNLHETIIRNEHAYYTCIAQLLSIPNDPSEGKVLTMHPNYSPIYVCGDSHVLATSWRTIKWHNTEYELRPALITGLKHWHLRVNSNFYPKVQFWQTLASLPLASTVIFVLGEIDCREGILQAVEKCRYNNIEEGMTKTINVFINILQQVRSKFQFRIFLHPVVPVLNETRHLVIQYNSILQKEAMKHPNICTWLDFFDELLENGSPKQLKADFHLDGTHLHPQYLTLITSKLNQYKLD